MKVAPERSASLPPLCLRFSLLHRFFASVHNLKSPSRWLTPTLAEDDNGIAEQSNPPETWTVKIFDSALPFHGLANVMRGLFASSLESLGEISDSNVVCRVCCVDMLVATYCNRSGSTQRQQS